MMPPLHPYVTTILHEPATLVGSLVIAVMATYVAIEFAGRLRQSPDRVSTALWMGAGSITMGSGIWAMHFVGMSAARYPFVATYGHAMTMVSWLAAVVIAAVILATASVDRLRWPLLAVVSIAGGIGATGMHFTGMAALNVAPTPALRLEWASVAAATAAVGICLGLLLFRRLHALTGFRLVRHQLLASAVLGGALAAMHYLSMAATSFATGSICTSDNGLDVDKLGTALGFATAMGLALVFVVTLMERRAAEQASRMHRSLDRIREKLDFVTFNDAVTGLPNRLVFDDRLQQAVAPCERNGEAIAVLFIALEAPVDEGPTDQRRTNETLHRQATHLKEIASAAATVASVGGGQFLVMVTGVDPVEIALQIAERVRADDARPPSADPASVRLFASIGVAVWPRDGGIADIVRNASAALVAVQRDGGRDLRFFEASMDEEARLRSAWLADLRNAVRNEQLELHYQPKVHARSGTIAGVEALIRWRHPVHGLVSPAVFIPLAERHGLIDEIGGWVVRDACRQMRRWREQGLRVRVAINVSPQQLRRPALADEILTALASWEVDPTLLTCEVTESGVMKDPAASAAVFDRLCSAGVRIAIDDFGTGYSSLSQLRRMPVGQLKIDRSFVNDLEHSDDARAIVATIVQMAHTLRLEVVAEGVETEEQRRILLQTGCDRLQGFLFARPMTASQLSTKLRNRAQPDFNASNLMIA